MFEKLKLSSILKNPQKHECKQNPITENRHFSDKNHNNI